jgi:hypothetical protein
MDSLLPERYQEFEFEGDALPAAKYDEALVWLRRTAREYLPNDPDALPPLQESLL